MEQRKHHRQLNSDRTRTRNGHHQQTRNKLCRKRVAFGKVTNKQPRRDKQTVGPTSTTAIRTHTVTANKGHTKPKTADYGPSITSTLIITIQLGQTVLTQNSARTDKAKTATENDKTTNVEKNAQVNRAQEWGR